MRSILYRKLSDRGLLILSVLFTLLFGLFAHLYGLTNSIFSHDALNALVASAGEEAWKIQLGRFMVPLYRNVIRVNLALPWLIGAVGLLFIGAALYLTAKLLRIRTVLPLFLAAGILSTNLTVTAMIATYVYEFDIDMAALLLAVLAVYLWERKRFGFLLGAVPLALSLGFYQAYFTAAITLILLTCLFRLLSGDSAKDIFLHGLRGILMLLLAGGLYYLLVLLSCRLTGNELSDSYNGLFRLVRDSETPLFKMIGEAYGRFGTQMVRLNPCYAKWVEYVTEIGLFAAGLFLFAHTMARNKLTVPSALLAAVLYILMPLAMNAIYVLDKGMVHQLMVYSFCFFHLFTAALLKTEGPEEKTGIAESVSRGLILILTAVLLWGNVQSANAVYLKKDLEYRAELSVMTRVLDKLESHPSYVRGETPVAVFGKYPRETIEGFEKYATYTGSGYTSPISGPNPSKNWNLYDAYFTWILNADVNLCDDLTWNLLRGSETLRDMPVFPKAGCVRMIGGVLVIRMSESY